MRGFPLEIVNEVRYYTVNLLRNMCWLHLYKAIFDLFTAKNEFKKQFETFPKHMLSLIINDFTLCASLFLYIIGHNWLQCINLQMGSDWLLITPHMELF